MDQTLVNSEKAKVYRDKRDWKIAYEKIADGSVFCYPGVQEALNVIKNANGRIAVVSTSPGGYLKKIIEKYSLPIDVIVGYRKEHKPKPDQMLEALAEMGVPQEEYCKVLSFGDAAMDITASKKAGIKAIACTWGTDDKDSLLNSNPDKICDSVKEMSNIVEIALEEK
jgi:phosphoglycolate phosphatase/pyrophosphatase PpaX